MFTNVLLLLFQVRPCKSLSDTSISAKVRYDVKDSNLFNLWYLIEQSISKFSTLFIIYASNKSCPFFVDMSN